MPEPTNDEPAVAGAAERAAIEQERYDIQRAGKLHWFHWLVIVASLLLTLAVWQFSRVQLEAKQDTRFERDAEQTISLLVERLQKYEDALWAGTAAIRSHGGDMSLAEWRTFANGLELGEKYPGINGIGVIRPVSRAGQAAAEQAYRTEQPGFRIHPPHQNSELMPIVYIVPTAENAAAVGLDMAHENNRFTAAVKARETGTAQITGPIVLVQDAEKTPGFLFYAPYYSPATGPGTAAERGEFAGLVYAPFVVKKLLGGTLKQDRRQVGITIRDGDNLMYDENVPGAADYDAEPMIQRQYSRELYGRRWDFQVRTTQSFRRAGTSSQPTYILAGGLLLEGLLISLFLLLSRANRRAVVFAKRMSQGYEAKSTELQALVDRLKVSNEELAQFAFVASHDLQEPLRTLNNYAGLLSREMPEEQQTEVVKTSLRFINSASDRMRRLVVGLLGYSRIGEKSTLIEVDCNVLVQEVLADLEAAIDSSDAVVSIGYLPTLNCYESELRLLFQNLISNALKFVEPGTVPEVMISCAEGGERFASHWHFQVTDNGVGIAPEYTDQVFQIFKRLHTQGAVEGNGIGLANCRKIVALHGGEIWVESAVAKGSTFHFVIPK